jgi:hypothetical protein
MAVNYKGEQERADLQEDTPSSLLSLHDLRVLYYQGKTSLTLRSETDLIRSFLKTQTGSSSNSLRDLWVLYLVANGTTYSPSLSDMQRSFFGPPATFGGGNPSVFSFGKSIYTTANNQDKVVFGNILLSNTSVTASIWVNFRSNGSSNYDICFGYYGAQRWFFIRQGATNTMAFNFKSGGVEKGTGPAANMNLNTWYLMVGTHDPAAGTNNTTLRIYNANGTLFSAVSNTNAFSIDTTVQPLFIGRDVLRNTSCDANFDEPRVYSRVLTVAEQDQMAYGGYPTDSLIGSWNFNEGSGTTALDSSGGGNNGTLSGAAVAYSTSVPW